MGYSLLLGMHDVAQGLEEGDIQEDDGDRELDEEECCCCYQFLFGCLERRSSSLNLCVVSSLKNTYLTLIAQKLQDIVPCLLIP